jgi:hypothetical protein
VVYTVELRAGQLALSTGGRPVGEVPFALVREGEGLVRMELNRFRYAGIYRLEPGGALVCVAATPGGRRPGRFQVTYESILIALRPVGPRKP